MAESKAAKWALGSSGRDELTSLVNSRPLVALDYDGTLCPIRRRRHAAVLTAHTEQLLHKVCTLYPTAIISGRALVDLARCMGKVRPDCLVGNHGLEPGPSLARAARQVAAVKKLLAPRLARWPKVELEDKRYSLSLHYRHDPKPGERRRALIALASRWAPGLRQVEGKRVLNLVPPGGDKGRALERLLGRFRRERALYVGDDLTDEDAFKLPTSEVMSVRVGKKRGTAAGWYLNGRGEVDQLLGELIRLGQQTVTPPARMV